MNTFFQLKVVIIFLPKSLAYVLGTKKNRLIETVLLSTHSICFGREIGNYFSVRTFNLLLFKISTGSSYYRHCLVALFAILCTNLISFR